jgi:hypothetical protein
MASLSKDPVARTEPIRLFLSYARVDHPQVERLAQALQNAGFRVWWDAALEGGHHFAAEIERELEAADAVLVVWTEASVQSNWVLDEAMHGRDRGCLIPVRFDDTSPPLGFRQIQSIELAEGDSAQEVDAIGRAALRILGRPVQEPGVHPRSGQNLRRSPNKEKTPHWVGFAWGGFGLVAAIIFWALGR